MNPNGSNSYGVNPNPYEGNYQSLQPNPAYPGYQPTLYPIYPQYQAPPYNPYMAVMRSTRGRCTTSTANPTRHSITLCRTGRRTVTRVQHYRRNSQQSQTSHWRPQAKSKGDCSKCGNSRSSTKTNRTKTTNNKGNNKKENTDRAHCQAKIAPNKKATETKGQTTTTVTRDATSGK